MVERLALLDESARKAGAIRSLSLGTLAAAGVAEAVALLFWLVNRAFLIIPLSLVIIAGILISAITYWLARIGKVRAAGYFFAIGFLVEAAIITTLFGGFTGPLAISYLFPILVGGIVISINASFFIATLAAILYLAMIRVEQAGLLPQLITPEIEGAIIPYLTVYTRLVFFYLVAFLSWFAASRLNQALQSVRRYAAELQVANEKLLASEEELRASNEELRATEEELRASNEELQAANEELKKAQEQLIRSEKLAAIGQLAGGVGHELRNPLGAIKNAVYYIKGKVAKSELMQQEPRVMAFLNIIDEEVDSSNKIINDLLGFSRVGKPAVSPTRMERVIEEAVSRVHLPENIKLTKGLDSKLPEVEVDSVQIQQVLINMITNAVQAMPDGGELTIIAREKDGFLELEVADTGSGIPEEIRDKIFDPLFTTRAKGIGLGLAVCKSIIERHQGNIEVESQLGKGTTFRIKLPLKQPS
jgi:signal transduction histidine kinase